MKRGLLVLILFLVSFGGVFAGEMCEYREYKGVYDYVYNPTDLSDVVIIKEVQTGVYVAEYNGTVSQEFGINGVNFAGNSGLYFLDDGDRWSISGYNQKGEDINIDGGKKTKTIKGDTYSNKINPNRYYQKNISNNIYESIKEFDIEKYKLEYKEIIQSGFSNDYKKYAIIGQKENGYYEIRGFQLNNDSWEEYNLYKGIVPSNLVYVRFINDNIKEDNLSILIKDYKGKYNSIFDGFFTKNIQEYSSIYINTLSEKYSLLHIYGAGSIKCTTLANEGDLCSEEVGIGLLDFKKNGYARYYNGTYKLYNYGNSIPIHSAYRVENEITGKQYIVLDGLKGKEYDYVRFENKYLFDTGILSYYALDNDIWYYIEQDCN